MIKILAHKSTYLVFYFLSSILLLQIVELNSGHYFKNLLSSYGVFFFLGAFAALIANSTGAGGGIVFIPAFIAIGLPTNAALATSFAIQCFGMSSGALSWTRYYEKSKEKAKSTWKYFRSIVLISSSFSLIGILIAKVSQGNVSADIELYFSVFSLLIGVFILTNTLSNKSKIKKSYRVDIKRLDYFLIAAVSLVGGWITAFLSVGVGELLAVLLIVKGYKVDFSIACAVCVSAFSVIFILLTSANLLSTLVPEILFFSAFGAMIGGFLARHLSLYLGSYKLKIIMSLWIIFSALAITAKSL